MGLPSQLVELTKEASTSQGLRTSWLAEAARPLGLVARMSLGTVEMGDSQWRLDLRRFGNVLKAAVVSELGWGWCWVLVGVVESRHEEGRLGCRTLEKSDISFLLPTLLGL